MTLTENQTIGKYGKRCGYCNRNMLLPYEYERSCFGCGFNLIKRKHKLSKLQRKKVNFKTGLKYAEQKVFCICIEVYQIYEGNVFNKIVEVLTTLKNKKLRLNNILIE